MTSMARMTDVSKVFRPSREHVLAIALMSGIAFIGVAWAPTYLGWVLFVPIMAIAWVFHASTAVNDDGMSLTYLFRKNQHVAWDDLAGVKFVGAKALAATRGGEEFPMPGVTFNSLPELAEASRGRITDVITQAEEAADGKYEIIDKEGRSVLLTREEYDKYLATHPDIPGPRPGGTSAQTP